MTGSYLEDAFQCLEEISVNASPGFEKKQKEF